ncbi:PH domain-containing protein [Humitalea sp. 24SJ18S-53]|uniref:PH domain-containing protein n=1 Tax=Humitalea sp. 24SJ18S-53 TaxID=3422307 RepID=UPI003D6641F1
MSEAAVATAMETKRSYGPLWMFLSVLMLGLPFLGRQKITVTNERIVIEQGFWTKVRDDIEVFRIRDVVVKQSLYHRMMGIGDIVIGSMEGRTSESHTLKGVADPVAFSETIRNVWNHAARPKGPTSTID